MMCKKCNNTGAITTSYKDGHEDVDLCSCEYNPYTQLRTVKAENKRLREALEKISNGNRMTYCRSRETLLFGCANKEALNINCQSCDYFIAQQALGDTCD